MAGAQLAFLRLLLLPLMASLLPASCPHRPTLTPPVAHTQPVTPRKTLLTKTRPEIKKKREEAD